MQQGFIADKSLKYAQAPAGSIDDGAPLSALLGGSIPAGTTGVKIAISAQDVRWRDDGTMPTATVGMPQAAGTILDYQGRDLFKLRFISQVPGAILDIICYGYY